MGAGSDGPSARRPIERLLERFRPVGEEIDSAYLLKRVDLCHLGFWLGLGSYFLDDDPRLPVLGEAVMERAFAAAERRAVEFMIAHRLYRSDHTGEVISERFRQLTYPWHWHYTFLRGLDYLRLTPAISDQRLAEPIDLLRELRKPNGRWPLQKRIPGTLLVEMEKPGQDSRWNTLRALRVVRRRAAPDAPSADGGRHLG